jgi:hypothetical protein
LKDIELKWIRYQIRHCIQTRCNSNSVVPMSLHWCLESYERTQFNFMFGCQKCRIGIVPLPAREHQTRQGRDGTTEDHDTGGAAWLAGGGARASCRHRLTPRPTPPPAPARWRAADEEDGGWGGGTEESGAGVADLPEYSRSASLVKKARTSWRRSTRASAVTTRPRARWSAKPSGELSTGPQLWAMTKNSSEGAKDASTSPSSNTSHPTS